jgi:hypothetical protein
MLTREQRDKRSEYIRSVQRRGIIFVCPAKDRALHRNEEACVNCDCIDDSTAPASGKALEREADLSRRSLQGVGG